MAANLKEENRHIQFNYCFAHLIHVLVNSSFNFCFQHIDELLLSMSSIFSSEKNSNKIAEIFASQGLDYKKGPKIAPHRWFSRYEMLVYLDDYFDVFHLLIHHDLKNYGKKIIRVSKFFSGSVTLI